MTVFTGTAGNDTFASTPGDNSYFGLDGDDTFFAGAGNQIFDGGTGFNRLSFASLDPGISGGSSNYSHVVIDMSLGKATFTSVISGTTYNYTFTNIQGAGGEAGNDTIIAAPSGSEMDGLSGDDVLIGGAGNDTLIGDLGADRLTGGGGSDIFLFGARFFPGVFGSPFVDSTASRPDVITDFETGQDRIDLSGVQSLAALSLVRSANGSVLYAASNGDLSKPTSLTETVVNINGLIQASDIYVNGRNPDAKVIGTVNSDIIAGGTGNDTLIGAEGSDTLTGGAGSDTFIYQKLADSTASAPDLITDFATGSDLILLSAVAPTGVSIVRSGNSSFVFASAPEGSMQINVNGAVNGGDIDWGNGHGVYLLGDDRGDVLSGGSYGDTIHGGSGNDVIIGGAGADGLYGGAGADTFKYTAASDSTASATDLIFDFQTGQDRVDLTSFSINHISTIDNGSAEFLFVETTSGAIMQIAAQGADVIQANDFSVTGGTNFYMQGDGAANTLIGGAGKDVLDGHAGNDVLIGGGGSDALFGGTGSDTFKFLAASDSTVSAPDTIFDLETGIDKIDLRGVHAAGVGSYGIAYSTTASYLFVDVNGDGVNDMLIQIGNPNLHASDLLW